MIKSPSVHSNNYSLQNLDNYLKTVDPKLKIFDEYNLIITEYLELCTLNISVNDIIYAKFIIHKGIEMISHIFNHIFLYTKNIELCKHYCSKASHYYIEFIGQIGEDSHSFLQLNSKDAILFVYKKTIFDINNNYRKNYSISDKDHHVFNILKKETDVINNILFILLEMIDHTNVRRFLKQCISEKKDILSNFDNNKITYKNYETFLDNVLFFVDTNYLNNSNIQLRQLKVYFNAFIKKSLKKNIETEFLKKKLKQNDITELYEKYTSAKFITWLFDTNN